MKRATKIWLFAAAILIVAGSAVFCGSMLKTGWDFSAFGSPYYETDTAAIDEDFNSITISGSTEDIAFLPAGNGKCSVVFYEAEKEEHTATVENGTLSIGRIDTREWYEKITFFSFDTPKITVYLPQTAYDTLSVTGDTGDVSLPKDFSFASIDISVNTGDVRCDASASGLLRIATDTGDICCEELSAGELKLSVSTGGINIRDVDCAGNAEVNVSTGKSILTEVSCNSFASNGSTGDITLEQVTASQTVTIKRSTGDVVFKKCDASELLIETGTGDVTGSLLTKKIFIAQSDTGRVDVPDTTTGGKCKITTDTGSILITLSE
ncbi:MAG: DUF4097 family beta strand repeat protein [Clostridia bacterium]|nr:DUF4097 family beta strand repeat protein [Clostridia bacterium]